MQSCKSQGRLAIAQSGMGILVGEATLVNCIVVEMNSAVPDAKALFGLCNCSKQSGAQSMGVSNDARTALNSIVVPLFGASAYVAVFVE